MSVLSVVDVTMTMTSTTDMLPFTNEEQVTIAGLETRANTIVEAIMECAICLDQVTDPAIKTSSSGASCGHVQCFECWQQVRDDRCPQCRFAYGTSFSIVPLFDILGTKRSFPHPTSLRVNFKAPTLAEEYEEGRRLAYIQHEDLLDPAMAEHRTLLRTAIANGQAPRTRQFQPNL